MALSCATTTPSLTTLSTSWSFAQLTGPDPLDPTSLVAPSEHDAGWKPVESVPTSVQVELINRGEVKDPFKGLGEYDIQWIGERAWRFRTTFTLTPAQLSQPNLDLVFEGLDTHAIVHLDGKEILKSDNMFTEYRVSIKHFADHTSDPQPHAHTLTLTFLPTALLSKHLENRFLSLRPSLPENTDPKTGEQSKKLTTWNGPSSRLYVRKGQYGWGWDWGPVMMTVGPWKPIHVHAYTIRVTSQRIETPLGSNNDQPRLCSTVGFTAPAGSDDPSDLKVTATLTDSDGKVVKLESGLPIQTVFSSAHDPGTLQTTISWDLTESVSLWWPHTHGASPLYTLKTKIERKGVVLDKREDKVGFRCTRVVQEALVDAEGTAFVFEVNGKRIFAGGSNWIPADSFLTNMTAKRYDDWLELVKQGNQNMVRVWGGGVYEDPAFYAACDRLGLLVWQDFMFGCGQYPANEELCGSIDVEARQAVARLRNHACLAMFAGNNEDYTLAEGLGLHVDQNDTTSDYRKTNFPARHIYERILPAAVSDLSEIYYHRGSPYGGKDSQDPTVGDIHQWNVWHGSQEPWANWDKLAGRFISEFGMEGYPDIRTVDYWLDGDASERFPQSRTNCSHNKADGFERRLELYLMENFRHSFDMESYVYYTQVMQAETLAAAYRLWRRNWKGKGKEYTSGALVWQINDCWPTTSWALVDYFLRPKPAFFTIARELRPVTVGMARKDVQTSKNEWTDVDFVIEQKLEIWGNNSSFEETKVQLEVTCFDLTEGKVVNKTATEVTLLANASTELWKGTVPGQPDRTSLSQFPKIIVVGARLLDANGEVLARYANWPEPWKYITFPADAGLKITPHGSDADTLLITSTYPIKGLILDVEDRSTDAEHGEVQWSDQGLDLMPGDQQVVIAKGLKGRKVKARFLGDGTAETA